MKSAAMSNRSYPPISMSSLSTRRRQVFRPLSYHGMPKTPTSPSDGGIPSHRFSTSRPLMSPPLSPMSPPMSAKSFGTFIDSEPSTPAYSPRAGSSNWDSNTLLLLSPVSTAPSSVPASPLEPVWEMMTPIKRGKKPSSHLKRLSTHTRTISISSDVSRSIHSDSQKENAPPSKSGKFDPNLEVKSQAGSSHGAPLGKLATRMKSILRRKTVSEKKTEKKRRGYAELDRMESVHWTEM